MAKRGQLTTGIQQMAVKFWGREITQAELHLYPYVHHCAINGRSIDPKKINLEEREIMQLWKATDHFSGGISHDSLYLSKEFFDFINDMLYYAYHIYDELPE